LVNKSDLLNKLNSIPHTSGCYLMKNNDLIIYVGKAKDLYNRVNSYFIGTHNNKTTKLVLDITDFEYIITNNEKEALILEINLIKKYLPKYNILLVDDKNYPYIEITKEEYPRLILTRDIKKKHNFVFGPYPTNYSASKTIKLLNDIYPFRKCKTLPKKECIYYSMGKCLAPCINHYVDYKAYINQVVSFLKGNNNDIKNELTNKMNEASINYEYEKALEYRDLLIEIDKLNNKQEVEQNNYDNADYVSYVYNENLLCINILMLRRGIIIDNYSTVFNYVNNEMSDLESFITTYYIDKLESLDYIVFFNDYDTTLFESIYKIKVIKPKIGKKLKLLNMSKMNAQNTLNNYYLVKMSKQTFIIDSINELNKLLETSINKIEVFDNAHLFGSSPVSSMIVFENNNFNKKEYRKYHLKTSTSDDLLSIKEVVYRRYFRLLVEKKSFPDLILLDGGINQVNAAIEVLSELNINIKVAGLVKNENHKLRGLIYENKEYIFDKNSNIYKLLLSLSEEVHRFSITFHKQSHNKSLFSSILDNINGIGKVTKEKLIKKYDSLKEIYNTNDEELAKLGLNKKQIANLKEGLKYYD